MDFALRRLAKVEESLCVGAWGESHKKMGCEHKNQPLADFVRENSLNLDDFILMSASTSETTKENRLNLAQRQ